MKMAMGGKGLGVSYIWLRVRLRCRLTGGGTAHDVEEETVENEDAAVSESLYSDELEGLATATEISKSEGHVNEGEHEVNRAESP